MTEEMRRTAWIDFKLSAAVRSVKGTFQGLPEKGIPLYGLCSAIVSPAGVKIKDFNLIHGCGCLRLCDEVGLVYLQIPLNRIPQEHHDNIFIREPVGVTVRLKNNWTAELKFYDEVFVDPEEEEGETKGKREPLLWSDFEGEATYRLIALSGSPVRFQK